MHVQKHCKKHGETKHRTYRNRFICLACDRLRKKEKYYKIKDKLLSLFGRKCLICGYDKCVGALDFHHLNKEDREFKLSGRNIVILPWEKVLVEAKKCILICANCHREIHAKERETDNVRKDNRLQGVNNPD